MSICIIDTSVFCNIMRIPNMNDKHAETMQQMQRYIAQEVSLLLPMTAVVETGNHIAQTGNGHERRRSAETFQKAVLAAIAGTAPWNPTPFWNVDVLQHCLSQFPDHAMRGIGLGDLSIIEEFKRQCAIHRARRVFIWSYDADLEGYDRIP